MSRGNQREVDRAKAQAKQQAKLKQEASGGTNVLVKNENDAAALQAKVAAKKAQQEAEAGLEPAKAPVVRKKIPKAKDSVDDMLSAGLSTGKKKRAK